MIKLMLGDNIKSLKELADNSIDSIVTDPPYGLSFMGKKWDYDVPSVEFWKEVYRVLKPGGHILSFGGTRTYHRMVVNIEDAGFEIRDQIMWIYGSGFPKSHNIGKAVDKIQGNEREIGDSKGTYISKGGQLLGENTRTERFNSKGSSPYEGLGTALKPANEPICLARKPLSEKTIADNVLRWGTGGINIDGCRIDIEGKDDRSAGNRTCNIFGDVKTSGGNGSPEYIPSQEGRFPSNIIFDEESGKILDEQSGIVNQGHWPKGSIKGYGEFGGGKTSYEGVGPKDKTKSGASRFFYVAKVSKKERNLGLDVSNIHPTLKPINLMTYLCRLITPQGGTILDPFMGSGSTGISAKLEGFNFVGMEMDEEYFKIAQQRIISFEEYRKLIK